MTGREINTISENQRGQSPLIGVVLMMGLVAISLAGVLLIGSGAVSEIRGSVEVQNAEHTMREVDARLSQVAFSANDAHTLDFSGQNGDTEVTRDGRMTITVVNGTNQPCREEIEFGAIEYQGANDEVVAYQAGGVWKRTDGGSVMLSPPDMQYRNGTFSFQMVNVTGSVSGSITQLHASKNATASRADSQSFRETFNKARCNPPDNATLTVHSDYYRAWGDFFETHVDDGVVTIDDGNETASLTVILSGSTAESDENSLSARQNASVTVKVLGTEISSGSGTSWEQNYTTGERERHGSKYNAPINMRINIGDDTYEPWGDGVGSSSVIRHDINDPTNGEYYRFTENVTAGDAISVEGTAYDIGSVDSYSSAEKRFNQFEYNGDTYDYVWDSYRTNREGSMMANIVVDTDGRGESEGNVVLLADGMAVPNYGSANEEQRSMSQILGSRMTETGFLDLDPNEFVLVYELSCADATTDDIDNPDKCGSGDPDYNDAVVLISIHEHGSVAAPEDFRIHVTMNQVEIEKSD
ncbi:DUF7289 family protein [Haladaptatus cibarius]|uniref:DUF7289 family protein n=1 Tax=Haladaptatus cibarius TaxID=453847 RepID=UPI0006796611|nr:hypothetical protein [Haladaptatus cibarius]